MSRREKLYHLHDILRQRRTPIARQRLMEELGCSQATLYRLIAELRDGLGAPVEQDPDSRGYFYDRSLAGQFELPGLWISPEELQALLTARHILSNVQPGLLEDELSALQSRIGQLLDREGIDFLAQPGRVRIRHDAGRPVPARLFEHLLSALFERQRVWIRYHGRRRDDVTEREISPQRLTSYRDRWYLEAWCHTAADLRSFAVERVLELKALPEPAQEVPDEVLSRHFDPGYGIFSGPAAHRARLKFSAEAARWAAEEEWHPAQCSEFQPDGQLILAFPFGASRELVMDILRYGPDVEVLAPEFLRAEVLQQAQRILSRYQTDAVAAISPVTEQ